MKITLSDWGSKHYSPPPSKRVLRAWVNSGQIHPLPERVGLRIMVDESAVRIPMPEISRDIILSPDIDSILFTKVLHSK
jgi:hypothetical protein